MSTNGRHTTGDESGLALIATLAVSVPLLLMVGAATTSMLGHDRQLMLAIDNERAFQAAESGVDAAIYRARVSLLDDTDWGAEIAGGVRYDARPVRWGSDGADNDDDGLVDEDDEQVMVVEVAGSYRNIRKTLSAAFAFGSPGTNTFGVPSPLYFEPNEKVKIKLKGEKDTDGILVSGFDRNLDGSRPAIPVDVPPITVASDKVLDKIEDKIEKKGSEFVEGIGLIEVRESNLDLDALIAHVDTASDFRVEKKTKEFPTAYGDSASGEYKLTYVTDKMHIKGDFAGAGILVVDGDLKADGEFAFDGLVIVRGKLDLKRSAHLNGAIIVRGKKLDKDTGLWEKASAKLGNDTMIQYSSEALNAAAAVLPSGLLPSSGVGGGSGSSMTYVAWRANYARSGHVDTADTDGAQSDH